MNVFLKFCQMQWLEMICFIYIYHFCIILEKTHKFYRNSFVPHNSHLLFTFCIIYPNFYSLKMSSLSALVYYMWVAFIYRDPIAG